MVVTKDPGMWSTGCRENSTKNGKEYIEHFRNKDMEIESCNFCDTKILALFDKDTDDLPCQVFLTRVGHKSNSHTIRLLISLESSVFQM